MISHNLPVLPPHQRTPHQLLRLRLLLRNLRTRHLIDRRLECNLPLPGRKVLVVVHRHGLDVQVVELAEGRFVCVFSLFVAHALAVGGCGGVRCDGMVEGMGVVQKLE
jgi:hypothetical protein